MLFREYDYGVTFSLNMKTVRQIYADIHTGGGSPYFEDCSPAQNYPIKVLGDDAQCDSVILKSGMFPGISMVCSKQAHRRYAANHCPKCHAFLGNYHLREQITDRFLKPKVPMERFVEF